MDYEKTKSLKLNQVLNLFGSIIKKASATDDFDYDDEPVDSHTDWDYIPDDSVRTVYNTTGSHHPDIHSHNYYAHYGVVITFDSVLGGNTQIFLSKYVLAIRKIGDPSGWSYLGLGSNQKIYINQDTAEVLNDIVGHAHRKGMIDDTTDQKINGAKTFLELPTYDGDPLVTRSELDAVKQSNHKADQMVNDNRADIDSINSSVASNSSSVAELSSSANSFATKSELTNYTPLNQLRYYVTKKTLDDVMSNHGILGLKQDIHQIDERLDHASSASVDPVVISNLKAQLQSYASSLSKPANSNIDLGKVKATIHKIDLRAMAQSSVVASNLNTASLSASSLGSGVSTNARRINSADARFYRLTLHDKKADRRESEAVASYGNILTNHADNIDKLSTSVATIYGSLPAGLSSTASEINIDGNSLSSMNSEIAKLSNAKSVPGNDANVSSLASSASNGISANAKRLNTDDTELFNIKQHMKKANQRYTHEISSLAVNHGTANPASVTTLSNNEKIDVQSLANQIKVLASDSADSKINSVVASAKGVEDSQSATNTSLSNALSNNASQTTSVENDLISALSKHQL